MIFFVREARFRGKEHCFLWLSCLNSRKDCNGKFAYIGLCSGGAMAEKLAASVPEPRIAILSADDSRHLKGRLESTETLQLHYAGMDERINAGIAA